MRWEDVLGTQGVQSRALPCDLTVLAAGWDLTSIERLVKEAVEVRQGVERLVEEMGERHSSVLVVDESELEWLDVCVWV